ncbi:MAG: conjugal transfer protein TraR [Nitrososphaeraceae archaeon]|nr:conjugal transfer protein TraR [Nitrososphaeraceae archaeon]
MLDLIFYLAILVGFIGILVKSAIFTTDNIVKFCKSTGVSEFAAGFIIVAITTSLPEISVAFFATYTDNVEITLGDIFGSNITNIALITPIFFLLSPIKKLEKTKMKGVYLLLISSIIPIFLLIYPGNKIVGVVLLIIFGLFVYLTLKTNPRQINEEAKTEGGHSYQRPFFYFIIGMAIVIISAKIIVDTATIVADSTGIGQSVIGSTIIALGTSLPELTVGIVAVRKKYFDLTLGNIIGSCVTNITLILGIVMVISENDIDFTIISTLIFFAIFTSSVMFMFLRTKKILVWYSIFLLILYNVYLFTINEIPNILKASKII